MKLMLSGVELDATIEHEIFANDDVKFGFNAVIVMKDSSIQVRNNLTEIHHLYKSSFKPAIAFESDIHGTGGTLDVDRVDAVVILEANKKAEEYYS